MSNIKAINSKAINPRIVIESLIKDEPELKELYAVGIDINGEPRIWATGDLSSMAFASMALQTTVHKYFRKEIESE